MSLTSEIQIIVVLITVNIVLGVKLKRTYELQMDRLEIIISPGGNSFNFTTLRITKFNRTSYVVKANFKQVAVSTNNVEVAVFVQFMQGNEYKLQPYKVNRKPLCDFYKNEFNQIALGGIRPFSNFPAPDDCPFGKQEYWVKDYVFDEDTTHLPPFIQLGKHRLDIQFYEKGVESGGFMFSVKAVRPGQTE